MTIFDFNLSTSLMLIFTFFVLIGMLFLLKFLLNPQYNKKKTEMTNNAACKRAIRSHKRRLITDYFWSNHMRAAWIMLFLIFFIALGFSLGTFVSIVIGFIFVFITIIFIIFATKSYKAFPEKAKKRLTDFEAQVDAAIKKEISFDGDNIQSFSKEDEAFDTDPQIFSFPVGIKKIQFPPFESNAKKQPIIATKRLEFLILSREYFSICKSAATFDLLNPKRAGLMKQCAEMPGTAGECDEHYYSQMRNVEYDAKKECIRIIYYDERDDVEFLCKKMAPNRKPAMKALKEKLRLTERQKLKKIQEHKDYEELKDKRVDREEDSKYKEEE